MDYQVTRGSACALVITDNAGKIISTAPIYKYLIGRHISKLDRSKYTIRRLGGYRG